MGQSVNAELIHNLFTSLFHWACGLHMSSSQLLFKLNFSQIKKHRAISVFVSGLDKQIRIVPTTHRLSQPNEPNIGNVCVWEHS